ncbi:AAA family ATPase [Streptomyces sp. PA03-1a]|nr:AAA family ATPase [Streptomyces sp. PA03-1a]
MDTENAVGTGSAGGTGGDDAPGGLRLFGRARERAELDGLLAGLPERGGAVLLTGEPGVGKSELLAYAARGHAGRVLRARGVESEAVLPYSVLADVLLPLRAHFAELPPPQRRALEGCLALSEPAEPTLYAVCSGALGVLAAAGDAEPLLVLVDDLQWADSSSRHVLQFVARRLERERVLLAMATRHGAEPETGWAGVPGLALSGLDGAACAELLLGMGLDPEDAAVARLVELSLGNPLVLVEYAALLRDRRHAPDPSADEAEDPLAGAWSSPRPLVERAWRGPLRALPPAAREALTYLAASRSGDGTVFETVLASVGLSTAALQPAEAAGLVVLEPGSGYRLRHPVLRGLVLHGCPPARRLRMYRVLADCAPPELRAWYLAAAATGPDEQVARALADAAEQARRRGAPGSAAETWHRAAELSPAPSDRAVRLLNAAVDGFHSGAARKTVHWCEEALRWSPDLRLTADIDLVRGQAHAWLGDPGRAHRVLVSAAESVRAVDPHRAGVLYGAATLPTAMSGQTGLALDLARRCAEFTEGTAGTAPSGTGGDGHGAPGRRPRLGGALLGATMALAGQVREGRELLLRERAALPEAVTPELQQLTVQIGEALSWADEDAAAASLLGEVVERIRRGASVGLLAYALAGRCEAESWRNWAAARADAVEAVRWARELGQVTMGSYAAILLARIDGRRGDRQGCERHIAAYRERNGWPVTHGLEVLALGALGSAALTAGDPDECVRHLERAFALAEDCGLGNPNMLTFVADLAEAHVRGGNRDRAAGLADWLDERARATGLAWPEAATARCRGLLATDADEAVRLFAAADRAHARREMPFDQARTALVHGEVMRRLRRPAEARVPLLAALTTFSALGARPWAARAEAELAAAGHRVAPQRAQVSLADLLTAQELQIARAVAGGLSNLETASTLFLSRKTVEAHLTRVYRKLGIRSRSDLARTLAAAGMVR